MIYQLIGLVACYGGLLDKMGLSDLVMNDFFLSLFQPIARAQPQSSPARTTAPRRESASHVTGCVTAMQTAPTRWMNTRTAPAGPAVLTSSPAAMASVCAAPTGTQMID